MGMVIALRCAGRGGYRVTIYDISDEILEGTKAKLREAGPLIVGMGLLAQEEFEGALGRIAFTSDAAVAASDADVLSESVPEILDIKRETHALFDSLLPAHAIQTTNTSHLLVSDMEDVVACWCRTWRTWLSAATGSRRSTSTAPAVRWSTSCGVPGRRTTQ